MNKLEILNYRNRLSLIKNIITFALYFKRGLKKSLIHDRTRRNR